MAKTRIFNSRICKFLIKIFILIQTVFNDSLYDYASKLNLKYYFNLNFAEIEK